MLDEVAEWQNRPLEPLYPMVFFDALRVKVRDEGTVRNKAVDVALGVRRPEGRRSGPSCRIFGLRPFRPGIDGQKEVLGLWIEQAEGAKFWLRVMTEFKNRGLEDVLIAVVDGLKGFPNAITAVFPDAQVQTCIVHLIRNSLDFVSDKDRRAVAAALKAVYKAGAAALETFAESDWGQKYPAIAMSWRRHWQAVIPFFAFADDVRRIIYTTNAIEALNAKLRRAVRTRGHFPTDKSVTKLLFLVLNLPKRSGRCRPENGAWPKPSSRSSSRTGSGSPSNNVQPMAQTRNF